MRVEEVLTAALQNLEAKHSEDKMKSSFSFNFQDFSLILVCFIW